MTNEEAKMQIQSIPEKIWNQLSEPDREAMEMAFSTLEKQEQDRWRSVAKEGTPKESGTYTCTFVDGGKRLHVSTVRYAKRTGSWILTGQRAYWRVIAWKPLPEPYKEEDNDKSGNDTAHG